MTSHMLHIYGKNTSKYYFHGKKASEMGKKLQIKFVVSGLCIFFLILTLKDPSRKHHLQELFPRSYKSSKLGKF